MSNIKVNVSDITNVDSSSGVPTINTNFDDVSAEFDLVHYRDGSLAATDDWDMDSNRIYNLPVPTTATEAARHSQILDVLALLEIDNYTIIAAVDTATNNDDGNITLSGEQTINGVTTSASRVLLTDQTTGSQNGIWVTGAGAWTRASDFNETSEVVKGSMVVVEGGNRAGRFVLVTDDPITVGTTSQDWRLIDSWSEDTIVYQRTGTGSVARTLNLKIDELPFTFQEFGAVGDGVTDDTTAINNCFAAARTASGTVLITSGTYRVTGNIFVYNGVKRIIGSGGEIKFDQSSGAASFVLATTGGVHVNDCLVEGVTLNANGKQTLGFYGQNVRRCSFRKNYIYGLSNTTQAYAFFLKSFHTGAHAATHNLIENNRIEGETTHGSHADGQISIVVTGDWSSPYNGYADLSAEWKATFTNIVPTYYAEDNVVRNNIVNGGRYGMELIGAKNTTVEGNVFKNTTRAISLQGRSIQNIIRGNHSVDTLASVIGLGYSCSNNLIDGNTGITSLANSDSEGAYFAYVGCQYNIFQNNTIRDTGATGFGYMLYAAIHATGNVFRNNYCEGPIQNAYMAVESGWDNTVVEGTHPEHRGAGESADINNFANTATTNVSFMGNEIVASSAAIVMFMGQFIGVGVGLTYINFSGNRIRGSYSRVLKVLETNSTYINNCTVFGNIHPTTSSSGFLIGTYGRGLSHFTVFDDPKLLYTATYDPASIAAGLSVVTTIAVGGAAIGDFVEAAFSNSQANVMLNAYVSAAGTVSVIFANPTGGAIDLSSGTLSVRVKRA